MEVFDEGARNGYSGAMRVRCFRLLPLFWALLLIFASCSFNYGGDAGEGPPVPGLVLENAQARRYEEGTLSVVIEADAIEMYDSDRVWAGEGVSFRQFAADGTGAVEAEGSADLLLVDDAAKVYTLGGSARFRYAPDGIALVTSDIRWEKDSSLLRGSADGVVRIEKDDGSRIEGTGFFADTLARNYRFERSVSGAMVNPKDDTQDGAE